MNFAKVRKAVAAFVTTAASVFVSGLLTEVPQTDAGWAALIGGSVGAGCIAAFAVFKVRNAGSVNGSYPETEPAGHQPVRRRTGPPPYGTSHRTVDTTSVPEPPAGPPAPPPPASGGPSFYVSPYPDMYGPGGAMRYGGV